MSLSKRNICRRAFVHLLAIVCGCSAGEAADPPDEGAPGVSAAASKAGGVKPCDSVAHGALGPAPRCGPKRTFSRMFGVEGYDEWFQTPDPVVSVDGAGNTILGGHFVGSMSFGGATFRSRGEEDVFLAKLGPNGDVLWSRQIGDESRQNLSDVAVDPEGNILVTGTFGGTIDFGGGPLVTSGGDIFLAKLDPSGAPIWQASFGEESSIQGTDAVTADPDGNVILLGHTEVTLDFGGIRAGGLIFLVKFDPSGRPLWGESFGGSVDQIPRGVETDRDGNIYVAEEVKHTVIDGQPIRGAAFYNALVAKFEPDGDLAWAHIFREYPGPSEDTSLTAMTVDPAGNACIAGVFRGPIDFGAGPIVDPDPTRASTYVTCFTTDGDARWSRAFAGISIAAMDFDWKGDLVLAGTSQETFEADGKTLLTSAGGSDVLLAKLRADSGALLSAARYGDAADQRATDLAIAGKQRLVVTGVVAGRLDFGCGPLLASGEPDLFLARLTE